MHHRQTCSIFIQNDIYFEFMLISSIDAFIEQNLATRIDVYTLTMKKYIRHVQMRNKPAYVVV
jgi:hypothetical protein